MTSFFNEIGSSTSLLFACHIATQGQNFKSSDCTSKLVSKLFEPKFSFGRTKCEAIIVKIISPIYTDKLRQELDRADFLTVTIDASNTKKVKFVSIVVLYFLPETAIEVKLLKFKSVSGEIAEILSKCLLSVLDRTRFKEKLIEFSTDSCNTNFGGVKMRGQNNVFCKS